MEKLLVDQVETNQRDVEKHIKLIDFYTSEEKFNEALEHIVQTETLQLFPHCLDWYRCIAKSLEAILNSGIETEDAYLLELHSLDMYLLLHTNGLPNPNYNLDDVERYLHKLDQTLFAAATDNKLTEAYLNHMKGQLCFNLAVLILKKAASKGKTQFGKTLTQCEPLFLMAWNTGETIKLPTAPSELLRKIVDVSQQIVSLRLYHCSHTLYEMVKEEKVSVLERVTSLCENDSWKEQLYNRVFAPRLHMPKTSFFMQQLQFDVELDLPSSSTVEMHHISAACNLFPQNLPHCAWLNLQEPSKLTLTPFDNVIPQNCTNPRDDKPDTLCLMDLQAFMSATVLAAQEGWKKPGNSTLFSPLRRFLPPFMSCTENQKTFWLSAYTMCFGGKCDDHTRRVLQEGIAVLRAIGNHGVGVKLLVHWAKFFAEQGEAKPDVVDVKQRASHYWSIAVDMCDRIKNKLPLPKPKKRFFEVYTDTISDEQVDQWLDEGKLYLGRQLIEEGKYEDAIVMLEANLTPYSSFYLSKMYEKMALEALGDTKIPDATEEQRKRYVDLLAKSRDCIYLTLDRLPSPDVPHGHPLHEQVNTHLKVVDDRLADMNGTPRRVNPTNLAVQPCTPDNSPTTTRIIVPQQPGTPQLLLIPSVQITTSPVDRPITPIVTAILSPVPDPLSSAVGRDNNTSERNDDYPLAEEETDAIQSLQPIQPISESVSPRRTTTSPVSVQSVSVQGNTTSPVPAEVGLQTGCNNNDLLNTPEITRGHSGGHSSGHSGSNYGGHSGVADASSLVGSFIKSPLSHSMPDEDHSSPDEDHSSPDEDHSSSDEHHSSSDEHHSSSDEHHSSSDEHHSSSDEHHSSSNEHHSSSDEHHSSPDNGDDETDIPEESVIPADATCMNCGGDIIEFKCEECDGLFCVGCDEANHKHPRRKDHTRQRIMRKVVKTPEPVLPENLNRCNICGTPENVDISCKDCNDKFCVKCSERYHKRSERNNHVLTNIKKAPEVPKDAVCDLCGEGDFIEIHCPVCSNYFCQTCSDQVHKHPARVAHNNKLKKVHKLASAPTTPPTRAPTSQHHRPNIKRKASPRNRLRLKNNEKVREIVPVHESDTLYAPFMDKFYTSSLDTKKEAEERKKFLIEPGYVLDPNQKKQIRGGNFRGEDREFYSTPLEGIFPFIRQLGSHGYNSNSQSFTKYVRLEKLIIDVYKNTGKETRVQLFVRKIDRIGRLKGDVLPPEVTTNMFAIGTGSIRAIRHDNEVFLCRRADKAPALKQPSTSSQGAIPKRKK